MEAEQRDGQNREGQRGRAVMAMGAFGGLSVKEKVEGEGPWFWL